MKRTNKIERLIPLLQEIYNNLTCKHSNIMTSFTGEVFLIERWERCSGAGNCLKCGRFFNVIIPKNESEKNNWK